MKGKIFNAQEIKLPRQVKLGNVVFDEGINLETFIKAAERNAKILDAVINRRPDILLEIIKGDYDAKQNER